MYQLNKVVYLKQEYPQTIVGGSPIFSESLIDTSKKASVNLNTRRMYQSDGSTVAWDWINGIYKDPDGKTGIRAYDRGLTGYDQLVAVDWDVKRLYDSNLAKLSVDWENRKLYKSDGTTVSLDWNTTTPLGNSLSDTYIFVGNGSNIATGVAMSGDATIANTGALTLANSGVSAATYGSATQVAQVTFDAKGRATSASNTSIQIAESQVTNLTTDLAGKASTATTISTTAPLSGGGDLSANRTITTSMATNKLIGRGTAGTGVMEEITLGTNLSLSGTTLNASGTATSISTANEATDTTCFPVFVTASGTQTLPAKTNTTLTYNSNTNAFGAYTFVARANSPEGTAFDFRDSSQAATTFGYTAFGWWAGTSSGSIDLEHTNASTAAGATVDHTFFMDDATKYCGIGQASKNYNVAGSSAIGGYDAYWYSQTASLEIIAYAASQHIDLCTGGGNTTNIRARASDSGFHIYGATAYMPLAGPTAANGAVQSVAAGSSTGQPLVYKGASALPAFETISAMGAVQSIGNTSATTPTDATGTATNIVVNNSGTQANQLTSGSSSKFTATATTRPSIQCDESGYIDVNFSCWFNGAATSPYYYIAVYVGGTLKARIDFLNNNAYYNPVSIAWAGSYTANQEIKIMIGQTNGSSAKATTCVDYVLAARWRKYN